MNEAIITRQLTKRYGRCQALDGFSLSIPAGSITGLVGRNGAGKTTWMMCVAGFSLPEKGEISILGSGPFNADIHSGRFTILPQDSELPLDSRVRSLLVHYALLQGFSSRQAESSADALLKSFNLVDKANSNIRSLSHGMRKRVMVAQAFLGNPEVVMLDEPLSGLDPVEADRLRSFILAHRGKTTVVISSHQLDDIQKLCSHVAFVDHGRVVRMENIRSLTSDTGRISYALKSLPVHISEIETSCPGVTLKADGYSIVATFDESQSVESVNAALLPRLLPFGVISVTPGRTLEEAYLNTP